MSQSNSFENAHFPNFKIVPATYKTVNDHGISADFFIPETLISQPDPSKSYPIILRVHGGGLVTGSSLFPDWFPSWALELATRHSAVIISPNHRLAPEASIDDILEDIEDFWKWVHDIAPTFIAKSTNDAVHVDTARILTAGESAGGFLSLYLGLTHPDEIKAVTAAYPMVDCKSDYFTKPKDTPIGPFPYLPESIVDAHFSKLKNGELPLIISADDKLERGPFMGSLIQNGRFADILPLDRRDIHLLDKIEDGARFPRGGVFVWHGKDDTIVPIEGTEKLAKLMQKVDPSLDFRFTARDGEHGFDGPAKLDDEWLADGMRSVVTAWLA